MKDLTRFAWLSIAAALVTIALKTIAWLATGSVGLLSDAAESVVNLVAAVVALIALKVAAKPADEDHQYGHAKAEYFAAGVEGAMIFVAAGVIIVAAVERLVHPVELESVGVGLAVSIAASAINGVVAVVLMRAGRRHRSITLTADGRHLLTDVWTSAGVVLGVLLVALTGWLTLDALVALGVGINILLTGGKLVRESALGLMDTALEPADSARLEEILDGFRSPTVDIHEVRTRVAARRLFAEFHVLVPGAWSVQRGHDLLEEIESAVAAAFPGIHIATHLEPIEDERSHLPVEL